MKVLSMKNNQLIFIYLLLVHIIRQILMFIQVWKVHKNQNLKFFNIDSVIRLTASSIIIHEKYNSYRQTDDIALVILEDKINFENIYVGTICLPNQSETYPPDGTYTV